MMEGEPAHVLLLQLVTLQTMEEQWHLNDDQARCHMLVCQSL